MLLMRPPKSSNQEEQANLLRDIVGNPFRPITVAPIVLTWQNTIVVKDGTLLGHLRYDGDHVRGCFAVGLILSKDH